jgi:hypothetical protein
MKFHIVRPPHPHVLKRIGQTLGREIRVKVSARQVVEDVPLMPGATASGWGSLARFTAMPCLPRPKMKVIAIRGQGV